MNLNLPLLVSCVGAAVAVIATALLVWNCKRAYANLGGVYLLEADTMELQAAAMTAIGSAESTALAARIEGQRMDTLARAEDMRRKAWPVPVKYEPLNLDRDTVGH